MNVSEAIVCVLEAGIWSLVCANVSLLPASADVASAKLTQNAAPAELRHQLMS
jgi:hypothetical protein